MRPVVQARNCSCWCILLLLLLLLLWLLCAQDCSHGSEARIVPLADWRRQQLVCNTQQLLHTAAGLDDCRCVILAWL
jgi:hypothetical protein